MKVFIFVVLLAYIPLNILSQESSPPLTSGKIAGVVFASFTGQPIGGVQISITGTETKVYSGDDGSYEIDIPAGIIWLNFSYPGYSTKSILITGTGQPLNVYLSGQKTRSPDTYLPGTFGDIYKYKNASFQYIGTKELDYSAQVSPEMVAQGRMSGVNVQAFSGMPGEGGSVNIRGISSLFASQNALIILDGVPINSTAIQSNSTDGVLYNPLSAIDVNDVASIEAVKDGASLYGIEGGQGLILINTKRPESVDTKVDFSLYSGVSFNPEYLKMLNTDQYKTYLINQMLNSGMTFSEVQQQNPWVLGNPSYYYYYNFDNNTNWQNEIFRVAKVNKVNASLQGGDEIARFYVSLGYLDQQAVVENTGYQRYNFRFNADVRILEKLYFSSNVGFTYQISDLKNFGINSSLNPITAALLKGPMYAPYLRDNVGNKISVLSDVDSYGFSNPTALILNNKSSAFQSSLMANGKLTYELTDNLQISSLVNIHFNNIKESDFIPDYGVTDFNFGETKNSSSEGMFKFSGITNETRISYTNNKDLKHFLTADAGFRIFTNNEYYFKGQVYNTPTDEFKSLSSVTSVENTYLSGFNRIDNRSDIFINGGYRYLDRYLLDVVLDLSGSSNVGSKAAAINLLQGKWGLFPSVHFGWLVSNESFLKSADKLDLLKVRASYSVSGNDFNTIQSKYTYNSSTYGTSPGLVRTYIPNQSLKWEQVSQIDVGVDAAMIHNKIQFSADIYSRKTSDLLTYRQTPVAAGFNYFWENNGTLTSKGVDVSARVKLLSGTWNIYLGGNLNLSHSEIEVPEDIIMDIPGGQVIMESGSNALSYYGMATDGIIHTAEEASTLNLVNSNGIAYQAGDVKFIDQDGNHTIDMNDRVPIGNLFPGMNGNITLDISYKRFTLNILGDFTAGNDIFNYVRMQTESFSGFGNQTEAAMFRWKKESDVTNIPRNVYGDNPGNTIFSDRWIENGNTIRLKEVTLAYQVPPGNVFKNLTIYVTGQNLWTSSDYLGYYPEFGFSPYPANQGSDYGQIPLTPTVIAGLKIGF